MWWSSAARQEERDLREEDEGDDHEEHARDVGERADHHIRELALRARRLHHIEVEPDGRRDQGHLDEDDQQDAEPDRIEADADDDRHDDGDRRDHQRHGLDEEAEHDVERMITISVRRGRGRDFSSMKP
jgi:hypothetical protein